MTPSSSRAMTVLVFLALSPLTAGCEHPYDYLEDESTSLGAVDPVNFPAANLGNGGNRMRPGFGVFNEGAAWLAGVQVGYFRYAFPTQPAMGIPVVPASAPSVFAFDLTAEPALVPEKNACNPRPGWAPNAREDDVRYDQQGNVFTALPTATYNPGVLSTSTYVPVVAAATSSSSGHECQRFKSRKVLEQVMGQLPARSGKFLAWLIIDPAAAVYPLDYLNLPPAERDMKPHPGLGVQKWGWYNRYLLAYLDGGEIPTQMMGMNQVMVTQRLYLPRSPVMTGTMMATAQLGQGLEVLTAKRGQPGYSPVCEVMTYDAGAPMAAAALPRNAATIEMMYGGPPAMGAMPNLQPASTRFVYCLQVR